METLTETKFKPQLMYVDQAAIDKRTKEAHQFADKINGKLNLVKNFFQEHFDLELSDDQLKESANQGIGFVEKKLWNDHFDFKKADLDFNLKAIGIDGDFEELKKDLLNTTGWINIYVFDIKDGTTFLTEEGKQKIIEEHTHYTKNESQNKAMAKLRTIVKEVNELKAMGTIGRFGILGINKGLKLFDIKYTGTGSEDIELTVKYNMLKHVNESGQIQPLYS